MPWSHCERDDITDDAPCPACGMTKQQWTVELGATRTFRVGRRASLNLELLDGEGLPVADERVLVTLPGTEPTEATLDARGRALVLGAPGDARVAFPDLPEGAVRGPRGDLITGPCSCPVGPKQTFRLTGVITRFVLVPEDGVSLVGVPFTLLLPDGGRIEGHVDEKLRVRAVTPKGTAGAKVQLDLELPDGHLVLTDADGDGVLDAPASSTGGGGVAPTPPEPHAWDDWIVCGLEEEETVMEE